MNHFEIVGEPTISKVGLNRIAHVVTFKFNGKLGECIVRNWMQNNMILHDVRMLNGYSRSEYKEIIDSIFDYVENDINDLRDQDHRSDAEIEEKENESIMSEE